MDERVPVDASAVEPRRGSKVLRRVGWGAIGMWHDPKVFGIAVVPMGRAAGPFH